MDAILTFIAALAGGLGAGYPLWQLSKRDLEQRAKLERQAFDRRAQIDAAMAEYSAAQLGQFLGVGSTEQAHATRALPQARARLAALGIDIDAQDSGGHNVR